MLPSAFQIINYPVQRSIELREQGGCNSVGGYFAGIVAVPINFALTPLTILADVVIGSVEALIASLRENPAVPAKVIAWKKIVASPAQQLTYFFTTALCFIPGVTLFAWPIVEGCAEYVTSKLPESINHKQINIFYNEGLLNGKTELSQQMGLTNSVKFG